MRQLFRWAMPAVNLEASDTALAVIRRTPSRLTTPLDNRITGRLCRVGACIHAVVATRSPSLSPLHKHVDPADFDHC